MNPEPSNIGQPVQIRLMRRSDIAAGIRLKQAARWNQTYLDWQRFLAMEPQGSYVACRAGRVVGTVTTCVFHGVAWIGMMLVDPCHRRQGIGMRLMRTALDRLDRANCTCVCLDATEMGAPLYRQLGFHDQQEIVRLSGCPQWPRGGGEDVRVRAFRWDDWPSLRELDRLASGADRTKLLKRLLLERPESARVVSQHGRLQGFLLGRPGSHADFIGPLVALSEPVGRALLARAFTRAPHTRVMIDIPSQNQAALALAEEAGMTAQRYFLRMVRGRPSAPQSSLLWASSGPEKG